MLIWHPGQGHMGTPYCLHGSLHLKSNQSEKLKMTLVEASWAAEASLPSERLFLCASRSYSGSSALTRPSKDSEGTQYPKINLLLLKKTANRK